MPNLITTPKQRLEALARVVDRMGDKSDIAASIVSAELLRLELESEKHWHAQEVKRG